jgi:hypothetical protein
MYFLPRRFSCTYFPLDKFLCDVLTISLALAHYAIYFLPRRFSCTYFPLDKFFYNTYTPFKTIPLRSVNSSTCQLIIFQLHTILETRPYQNSFPLRANVHITISFQLDDWIYLCRCQASPTYAIHQKQVKQFSW